MTGNGTMNLSARSPGRVETLILSPLSDPNRFERLINMGITGLLPFLKAVTTTVHISDYQNKTLGVDAYVRILNFQMPPSFTSQACVLTLKRGAQVWLHRGLYKCATELAFKGIRTDA
jgi:hypothetical protein